MTICEHVFNLVLVVRSDISYCAACHRTGFRVGTLSRDGVHFSARLRLIYRLTHESLCFVHQPENYQTHIYFQEHAVRTGTPPQERRHVAVLEKVDRQKKRDRARTTTTVLRREGIIACSGAQA